MGKRIVWKKIFFQGKKLFGGVEDISLALMPCLFAWGKKFDLVVFHFVQHYFFIVENVFIVVLMYGRSLMECGLMKKSNYKI
jgi:hypothetical protein